MTTVLEKLKALDAQRAQLLEGAKTEALDNAEKAVFELNQLGFHYTLTEDATSTARAPRKATSQASKRQARACLAPSAISGLPHIMMGACIGPKDQKALQCRRTYGEESGES